MTKTYLRVGLIRPLFCPDAAAAWRRWMAPTIIQSAAIQNYLGFPKGLTASDLTHCAVARVSRFGAEM